jgi:hypothetical protein
MVRLMAAILVGAVAAGMGTCGCTDQTVENPGGAWCRLAFPGDPGSEHCYADQATCTTFGEGCGFHPNWCWKRPDLTTECYQGAAALDACHTAAQDCCFQSASF